MEKLGLFDQPLNAICDQKSIQHGLCSCQHRTNENVINAVKASEDELLSKVPKKHQAFTKKLLSTFPEVFAPGLGRCKHFKAHLYLKDNAKPVFIPKRTVSYKAKETIEAELERLQKLGAIKPIQYSNWAAPIHCVKKKDSNDLRVTVDFSTGLNGLLEFNRYQDILRL
uniref:Uncharacterized protein n=1 Tax=Acrobeloides nanus TaxID=290746 RepID=A0A914DG48_9BILA